MSTIIPVPVELQKLAASYRYGYHHGSTGRATERESYFKTAEALAAYKAGYQDGVKARMSSYVKRTRAIEYSPTSKEGDSFTVRER